jgi:hypothetical protein
MSRQENRWPSNRRAWLAAGLLLIGALVGITFALLVRDPQLRAAAPPEPPATGTRVTTPPPDVTWVPVAGVDVPVSRLHGPRNVTPETASGFSQSEEGAALAAVHILVRTSAAAGPNIYRPTLTRQVVGANVAAMKLLLDEQYQQLRPEHPVVDGEPVTGDAEVRGYRVARYGPNQDTAAIDIVLTSPNLRASGQRLKFAVQLLWDHEDWRVVAPPQGDWATAMTTLGSDPEGMLAYERVR